MLTFRVTWTTRKGERATCQMQARSSMDIVTHVHSRLGDQLRGLSVMYQPGVPVPRPQASANEARA